MTDVQVLSMLFCFGFEIGAAKQQLQKWELKFVTELEPLEGASPVSELCRNMLSLLIGSIKREHGPLQPKEKTTAKRTRKHRHIGQDCSMQIQAACVLKRLGLAWNKQTQKHQSRKGPGEGAKAKHHVTLMRRPLRQQWAVFNALRSYALKFARMVSSCSTAWISSRAAFILITFVRIPLQAK